MKKLSWGILSTASIAKKHVLPAINNAKNAELRAIASRNKERADEIASDYEDVITYDSYEELIASDIIDAVYIPLPNKFHFEWTKKAFKSGKDVLCEKPLTLSKKDTVKLFEIAEETGNRLVEGFMYRYREITKELIKVAKNELGQIHRVKVDFSYRSSRPKSDIRFQQDLGGGALHDVGCYGVDFILKILGKPDALFNKFRKVSNDGVDLDGAAVFSYPETQAILSYSIASNGNKGVEISAEHGRIIAPGFFSWEKTGEESFYLYGGKSYPEGNIKEYTCKATDLYQEEIEAVSRAFLNNILAQPYPEESILNQEIIDLMFESNRKGLEMIF